MVGGRREERAGGGARHIRWVLFGRGVLDRLAELAGADLKVYIYGYQSRKTRPCRQKREQGNRPSTRIAAYRATRARFPPPARGLRSPVVQSYLKEKEKASSQGSLARSQGLGRVVGLLFLSWVEEGRQRTSALPSPERHGCRKCVSFELRYLRTATKALIVKDHDIDNETAALAAWDRSRADAGQGRTGCANSCARGRQTRPTAPTATC